MICYKNNTEEPSLRVTFVLFREPDTCNHITQRHQFVGGGCSVGYKLFVTLSSGKIA